MFGPYRLPLVETLLERLPHEPWSLYRAKQLGGDHWFGYSADSERLNALIDGQTLQTKATGWGAAQLTDAERAPRPLQEDSSTIVSTRDTDAMAAVFAAIG